MKMANRVLALLLTFILMLGMVSTEALAYEWMGEPPEGDPTETNVPEHVHNEDGWLCIEGDSTWELTCGQEEHLHTADCYAPAGPTTALTCGKEAVEGHTHTDACYTVTTTYTCGLEAAEGHVHDTSCYGEQPLVCGQEEAAEHIHGDDCYTTERTLTCETPENHVHTLGCYNIGEPGDEMMIDGQMYSVTGLNCTIPTDHTHGDGCYTETSTLTCTAEGAGHVHSAACYGEAELTCTKSTEGHTHTAECTREEKTLTCGIEVVEGHQHTPECYGEVAAPALICGREETIGHTHGKGCFVEKQVLVCGQEESGPVVGGDKDYYDETDVYYTGHHHEPSCWEAQKFLVCEEEAIEAHIHSAACYEGGKLPERGELICGKVVHIHADGCYAEIKGDWTCTQAENGGNGQPTLTASGSMIGRSAYPASEIPSPEWNNLPGEYHFISGSHYLYFHRSPHTYYNTHKQQYDHLPALYNLIDTQNDILNLVYCSDYTVGAEEGVKYKRVNLEDSTYYPEDAEGHIRAVMLHAYPYKTAQELWDAAGLSGTAEIGQIVTAVQFTIWRYSNGVGEADTKYNRTIDRVFNAGPEGKGHVLAPVSTYSTNSTTVGSNINKIIKYLTGLQPEAAPESEAIVINNVDIDVIKTTNGNKTLTLAVTAKLNGNPDSGSNLTATFYADNIKKGSATVISDTVALTLRDVPPNAKIKVEITGTQNLPESVYFYTTSDGQNGGQNFVGVGGGSTTVSAVKEIGLDGTHKDLKLVKYAIIGGEETDIPVQGATFNLFCDGKQVGGPYVTDEHGEIIVEVWSTKGTIAGSYYFVEDSAPDGFESDSSKVDAELGSTATAYNCETTDFSLEKWPIFARVKYPRASRRIRF